MAWLTTILFGLALPAVLLFFAFITGGPIESSTPTSGKLTGGSLVLLDLARLIATAETALVVVLALRARHHGRGALLVWIPGLVSACAVLLLWDIQSA